MGRHASDVMAVLTVRVPRGHQGFWEIIRELHRKRKTWTLRDVDGESNTTKKTVHDFIQRLARGGFIQKVGLRDGSPLYKLVKDQPAAPRLKRDGSPAAEQGRGQDQMWRSMKMLRTFDLRELSLHASTEEVPVSQIAAKHYIKHLKAAGYLTVVLPGRAGRQARLTVYRLIPFMNTGPLAPQIQRTDFVWDPNRLEVMAPESGKAARGAK
jgi:hypothetical protein